MALNLEGDEGGTQGCLSHLGRFSSFHLVCHGAKHAENHLSAAVGVVIFELLHWLKPS
jgi:hypothetical protein